MMGKQLLQFTRTRERKSESAAEIAIRFDSERRAAIDGERQANRAAAICIVVAVVALGIAFYFFAKARL